MAQADGDGLPQIVLALEATYDPRTPNDTRRSALDYLDTAKRQPDAPQHGYSLALDKSQQPAVRHFGLSLLEYALRHRWEDYTQQQADTLRGWVLGLARDISQDDPLYFRNKVALLWIEVAKRSWGAEWTDMDELLVALWETPDDSKSLVYRQLVLYVLECLSEDICNREDPVAGLRQDVLGQALNEVMIPQGLYQDHLATRGNSQNLRCTQDGWLSRMCEFVTFCSARIAQGDESLVAIVVKTLEALKPTVVWISFRALTEANCVDALYAILLTNSVSAQTASVEVLQSILARPYNPHFHETWATIMRSSLQLDRIQVFRTAHSSCASSPDDIEESRYTLQKKLSEVLSILGDALSQNPQIIKDANAIAALFDLLVLVFQSDSLLVSIPVLHSFTRLLLTEDANISSAMMQRLPVLLDVCSKRLLKYESFSQDAETPVVAYLNEDFENLPELHAFLGNYRRYCINIIERIAAQMPQDAVMYVLDQTAHMVEAISDVFRPSSHVSSDSKVPLPVLQLEAQASVLRSTLNGFTQWLQKLTQQDPKSGTAKDVYDVIVSNLKDFSYKLVSLRPEVSIFYALPKEVDSPNIQHPDVARISMHMVVNVLTRTLQGQPELVVKILDYILSMQFVEEPSQKEYADAVRSFQGARLGEIQRIAMTFPDYLLDVYGDLEARVAAIMGSQNDDERLKWGLQSFLFIIIHRASAVDQNIRIARLQSIVDPILESWQSPQLTEELSSFQGFCRLVGLEGLPHYLMSRKYSTVQDWSREPLDQDGKARQADVQAKTLRLPLNATKNLLGATTERLKDNSLEYEISCRVWGPTMQAILPNVLNMARHATAFGDESNWADLPPELRMVMQKILVDRFWQSGISNESRDEFYARIAESGSTYEGFASTIRGIPRQIRDWCYHILYGMTRFEEEFFGLKELPVPLAEAVLSNASALSTHHLQRLISLVERLVTRCPPHHRHHFLPPLLTRFFSEVDKKISSEWESIEKTSFQTAEDDQLGDEMKSESILRATTYAVVSFAASLFEHQAADIIKVNGVDQASELQVRNLVLSDPSILELLILFCTHTLRMRDSRCCTTICRVLRSIIPIFNNTLPPSPQVREFISTEVLKACITSLNEPYFVDVQRDLATLIAQILHLYTDKSDTARDVLCSLPDMQEQRVEKTLHRIREATSERTQRLLVLDLLEGVRGVSIHEAGKIDRRDTKTKRSVMQQGFMEVETKPEGKKGESPGLEGMAEMFGGA
ncbi:hypothetical protein MBLNU459_g6730t1 [Dothideomycetes sp. NU459]